MNFNSKIDADDNFVRIFEDFEGGSDYSADFVPAKGNKKAADQEIDYSLVQMKNYTGDTSSFESILYNIQHG